MILNYISSRSCCEVEEIDKDGNVLHSFKSANEAEKFYGFSRNRVKPLCDGIRKTNCTCGHYFQYANPLKRKWIEEQKSLRVCQE